MGILPWIQRMNFRGNYLVPYLPVYPAASLRVSSIRLSLQPVYVAICLPLYWSPSLLVSLSIGLPLYRSPSLPVSLYLSVSTCLHLYLSSGLPLYWSAATRPAVHSLTFTILRISTGRTG